MKPVPFTPQENIAFARELATLTNAQLLVGIAYLLINQRPDRERLVAVLRQVVGA